MQLRIDTLEAQLAALTGEHVTSDPGQMPPPAPPVDAHDWDSLVGTAMSASSASTESTSPDIRGARAGTLLPLPSIHGSVPSGSSSSVARPTNGTAIASGSSASRPSTAEDQHPHRRSSVHAAATEDLDPEMDNFRGGLALNAHGELRYYVRRLSFLFSGLPAGRDGLGMPSAPYSNLSCSLMGRSSPSQGPTSSYRSVLVATPCPPELPSAAASPAAGATATLQALRSYSLTRAPIPTAAPCEPVCPTRPPDLSPDLKARLFRLAFEFCFSHYNIVPERQFYQDLQMYPTERTQFYSPFLMHVVLAVGCRYLQPGDNYPPEVRQSCSFLWRTSSGTR